MRYEFKKSFDKSISKLPEDTRSRLKRLAFEIVELISAGKTPSKGYSFARLRKDYWEARATINERIIFKLTGDYIQFILSGSHEDIKRFLKNL